jgi:glycosyltransferase involved in cell wall biosynthesis
MIDARSVDTRQSGVGNYVTHLIKGLKEIDKKNHYILMVTAKQKGGISGTFSAFENYTVPFTSENHILGDAWEFWILPKLLRKNAIDIFHGPAFLAPPFQNGFKSVATIHDLVAFHHPKTIPAKYAIYMRFLIRMMIKKARGIITDTACIKEEIIDFFNIDPERIFSIPIAVSSQFRPIRDQELIDRIKKQYGIQKRYFLYVGNIEPRKNLSNLFLACNSIREKLSRDFQLVVTGKKGWLYREIFETLAGTAFRDNIVFTQYVNRTDIPVLYSGADFFVFPSLYEGFGLPILEAMSCGTPVITSSVSSMPEVAGDAALYVNPLKISDIAEKILALAFDESLRQELREKGFKQADKFTWERSARLTQRVYETIG